jgi:hypothetical protein
MVKYGHTLKGWGQEEAFKGKKGEIYISPMDMSSLALETGNRGWHQPIGGGDLSGQMFCSKHFV